MIFCTAAGAEIRGLPVVIRTISSSFSSCFTTLNSSTLIASRSTASVKTGSK